MSKEKKVKVSVKKTFTHDEAVSCLEDLVKSFKASEIVLQNDKKSLTLVPTEEINFKIKGHSKKQKHKLSIQFTWKDSTSHDHNGTDEAEEPANTVDKNDEDINTGSATGDAIKNETPARSKMFNLSRLLRA